MSDFKQNDVSQAVWPWPEIVKTDDKPGAGRLRRVWVQTAVMAVIGWVLYGPVGHVMLGRVVWTLALVVLLSGLFVPPAFRRIERFGKWLGIGVAAGLTWLLLVPFFYLVFAPARFFLRLRGKDSLCRECPSELETYWIPRVPVKDIEHYRKQH